MRLNLIGNGFDMYHGLPCSYFYFACFLAEKYYDFYVEMAKMFGFRYGISRGYPFDDIDGVIIDDIFWKTFEERLGELDSLWLEESLQDDLGLEIDDPPVKLDIPEEANSRIINEKFCEWVINTVNTSENFKIIKENIGDNKLKLSKKDYYINFNYTQVLEEIYGIDSSRINHIHGECYVHESNDNVSLIVGHGNDESIEYIQAQIDELEKDEYYIFNQALMNRMTEYETELQILRDLRKNVSFLKSDMMRDINFKGIVPEEICVWGLSCGEVDRPYIEELVKSFPKARWKFSYYSDDEKQERERFAHEVGIVDVDLFELKNPDDKYIREQMVKINNIIIPD